MKLFHFVCEKRLLNWLLAQGFTEILAEIFITGTCAGFWQATGEGHQEECGHQAQGHRNSYGTDGT
jgi:hypothetical protein